MAKKLQLVLFLVLISISNSLFSQEDEKIVIIIIDGARYSETFGDTTKTYTPHMWNIAEEGTIIDNFYNDGQTYTRRAIPALWCGAWTDIIDITWNGNETNYTELPTIFEYYRKQKEAPAEDCYYVLKEIEGLWLPSFDPDYGPDYWPEFHSVGDTDEDVVEEALQVMDNHHPHFLWIYLADVDHEGHSGVWSNYIGAIHTADSLVDVIWNAIQSDQFYTDATTMIVTNDHGRHDDQHGGFSGHGCNCDGCRHIQFLAVGPRVKKNYISYQNRYIPDMAVTAAHIADIETEKATGSIIDEILVPSSISTTTDKTISIKNISPNPFSVSTEFRYVLTENSIVSLIVRDFSGRIVKTIMNEKQTAGEKLVIWDGTNELGQKVAPGIYFYTLVSGHNTISGKLIFSN